MAQVAKGGTLYVSAKSLDLKSSAGAFANTKGSLSYGDQVTVLQVDGKWVEVRSAANPSVNGWTASASLSAKRVVSGNSSSASAKEIALAGKGFSQEIESAYKANGKLNYADVDRTEAQTIPEKDMYDFIVAGHLSLGGE
jgi:hypothetical protein